MRSQAMCAVESQPGSRGTLSQQDRADSTDSRSDEELVLLTRGTERRAALHALALRYRARMDHWVAEHARCVRLPHEDVPDAQQEAFLVLVRAAAVFDADSGREAPRCSFRTFLRLKVTGRVSNLARQMRRQAAPLDRSVNPEHLPDWSTDTLPSGKDRGGLSASEGAQDPALAVEGREQADRLEEALRQLDERAQWLVERKASGDSLRQLAPEVGLTYHRLRRLWNEIIAHLAAALRDCAP